MRVVHTIGRHLLGGGGHAEIDYHDGEEPHDAGGHGFTFEDVLFLMITLFGLWGAGKFAKFVGAPPLVGEIVLGIVVGPNLTDFAPQPDALMLVGELGILLLVLEAGLDVDLQMIHKMGARAVGIAVSGSLVPLLMGFGLASSFGMDLKPALAVGVVLSPTSVGIALNVLSSAKILATEMGQLIVAAAILDDIIALILLSELEALAEPSAWAFIKPLLVAILLLVGIGAFAIYAVPPMLSTALRAIPEHQRENFLLLLIFSTAVGMVPGVHYAGGSHLLGAFLAGFCFCTDHHVHHAWTQQVKRVMHWLLTIFFACTIGFVIPIKQLFTPKVMSTAAAYFVAILGKIATGFWATPLDNVKFFTVGFSMSAWGEFAFVVSTAAQSQGIMDQDTFSACILCVLLSTIFGPTFLRFTLSFRKADDASKFDAAALDGNLGTVAPGLAADLADQRLPVFYILSCKSCGRPGQQSCLLTALQLLDLVVFDLRVQHSQPAAMTAFWESLWHAAAPGGHGHEVMTDVVLKDATLALPLGLSTEEDLRDWSRRHEEILQTLHAALNDSTAKVELERWQPGLIDGQLVEEREESCPGEKGDVVDAVLKSAQALDNAEAFFCASGNCNLSANNRVAGIEAGPSLATIFAHADVELRARQAKREEGQLELVSLKKQAAMQGRRSTDALRRSFENTRRSVELSRVESQGTAPPHLTEAIRRSIDMARRSAEAVHPPRVTAMGVGLSDLGGVDDEEDKPPAARPYAAA